MLQVSWSWFGSFPGSTQAPKGPGLWSLKRAASRGLAAFEEPRVSSTTTHTALPSLSQQRLGFQGMFSQQARLYIHKLTPPDLRKPCARVFARDEEFKTLSLVSVRAQCC